MQKVMFFVFFNKLYFFIISLKEKVASCQQVKPHPYPWTPPSPAHYLLLIILQIFQLLFSQIWDGFVYKNEEKS